jgi:hypothetical protein
MTLDNCVTQLPSSAPRVLMEMRVFNNDTKPHTVEVVDANQGSFAACPATDVVARFIVDEGATSGPFLFDYELSTAGTNSLTVGTCDTVWGGFSVQPEVFMHGYLEPVHHLNQPR